MALADVKSQVRALVCADGAFQALPGSDQRSALEQFDADWREDDPDRAALAGMRLAARAGNGHTRVFARQARGVPWRMVWLGERLFVTFAPGRTELEGAEVQAIDGVAVEEVLQRLTPWLAGTAARRRAISGLAVAWPAAMNAVGLPGAVYSMAQYGDVREIKAPKSTTLLEPLYPTRESGFPDPSVDPFEPQGNDLEDHLHFRFPDCHDPEGQWLPARVQRACTQLGAGLEKDVILDLRGNRGGSFFTLAPLVDMLATRWRGARLSILVDKFTFSAAIVTVFRLVTLCPDRTRVVGEPMGDHRQFWAEGDFTDVLGGPHALTARHSDIYHDWMDGLPDPKMPADIRACLTRTPDFEIVPGGPIRADDLLAGRDPWLAQV